MVPCHCHLGWVFGIEPRDRNLLPEFQSVVSGVTYQGGTIAVASDSRTFGLRNHCHKLLLPRHSGEARASTHTMLGLKDKFKLPPDSASCIGTMVLGTSCVWVATLHLICVGTTMGEYLLGARLATDWTTGLTEVGLPRLDHTGNITCNNVIVSLRDSLKATR